MVTPTVLEKQLRMKCMHIFCDSKMRMAEMTHCVKSPRLRVIHAKNKERLRREPYQAMLFTANRHR